MNTLLARIMGMVCLAVITSGCACPMFAQSSVSVEVIRILDFGTLISGSGSKQIHPGTDPQAAMIKLTKTCAPLDVVCHLRSFRVQFTLPSTMDGPSNAVLPLSFANNAGGSSSNLLIFALDQQFNPNLPFTVGLLNIVSNTSYVSLGGTLTVPQGATPGVYSATILLTVSLVLI